jgi:hypothetical protein
MSERLVARDGVLTGGDRVLSARTHAATRHGARQLAALSAACAMFLFYYRLSWTAPVSSDGAGNILQVQDMLHGNLLLHGWWLSDVSYYTTELPQYMLIEAALGPVPAVIHVAAAMTYTLAVLLAAVLAKGGATGREGALRMVIAAGIMLAPQAGGHSSGGVFVLDLSLGHIGTSVPLMATWLLIDRAGIRRRWVPAAAGALLAWALVADPLVLYVGVVPVTAVCAVHAYRKVLIQRHPVDSARCEITLAVAALAAIPVAMVTLTVIHTLGGFTVYPVPPKLAAASVLPAHLAQTFESVLVLFGADFLRFRMGLSAGGAFLHLTGVALAAIAVWRGLRRFIRGSGQDSLVVDVMAVAVLINLAAFVLSTLSSNASQAREIACVLPFSAALAGRLMAGRIVSARLLPALAVAGVGYLFTMAHGVAHPAQPTQNQHIADWLTSRGFRYGLAGYWQASSVTLASGQRVQVRPVDTAHHEVLGAFPWESEASWYDPMQHNANFVLLARGDKDASYPQVLATFGKPVHTYRVGRYLVLVWNRNLLVGLHCGKVYAKPTGIRPSGLAPSCR